MKAALFFGLCILLSAGALGYAQVVIIDEPYSEPRASVYSGNQGSRTNYQRGYDAGFDDGYSVGYIEGNEHGKKTPYNRYTRDCDDIDDWDDWEECYEDRYGYPYVYPVVYSAYPVAVPYRYSQYSYAPRLCTAYGTRYC